MRTRSKIDQPNVIEPIKWSGRWPSTSPGVLTAYDYSSISDVADSDFVRKRRQGIMVNNSMTLTRATREPIGSGVWSYTELATGYSNTGVGPISRYYADAYNVLPPSLDVPSRLLAEAQLNAIKNIDNTPLSTGEDVLELGKTFRFLKAPLSGILKELRSVRRGNASSAYHALATSWLTYRFALTPLVRSVHGILSEVKAPSPLPPLTRVSHGRSGDNLYKAETVNRGHGGGSTLTFDTQSSLEIRHHAYIQYRVKNQTPDWRWRYGLRNKDIPETFWAVMPLSFMVDRMYDVSALVRSCTNLLDPSIDILGAGYTTKTSSLNSVRLRAEKPPPGYTSSISGETSVNTNFSMKRESFSPSLTLPRFTPKKLVKDLTNTLDLVTIVTQLLRR